MDKFLLDLLESKVAEYNSPSFIVEDPVSIPHLFSMKEDIEIPGFLAATIAWGQRKTILRNAEDLVRRMDGDPHDFIMHYSENDLEVFRGFRHRTFNEEDCMYFIRSLGNLYRNYGGLGGVFREAYLASGSVKESLIRFRKLFLELPHSRRTEKHVADPGSKAAAKRLNMFLRWMVRRDEAGVDFGIWDFIPPAALFLPLDIHTGNVARSLGLLKRNQNDWMAVEEVTGKLREMDPLDPVKYDFALFGMGMYGDV